MEQTEREILRQRRKAEEARLDEIGLRFFKNIDCSKIDAARQNIGTIIEEKEFPYLRESVYRVFHQSYKMYYLREYGFRILAELFRPLGFEKPFVSNYGFNQKGASEWVDGVLGEFRSWGFEAIMNQTVEDLYKTTFTMERNLPSKWYDDTRQLTSSFFMIQNVAIGSLNAMDRIKNKTFLLYEEPRGLDWDEALFMEAWESLSRLRYSAEYRREAKRILDEREL